MKLARKSKRVVAVIDGLCRIAADDLISGFRYKKSAEGKAANKAAGKRRGSVLSKLITRKSRMGGQSTMGSKGSKKKRGSKSSISASMLGWKPKYVPKAEDEIRTVYSWGDGEHGQLGHGESYTKEYISKQTKSMPGHSQIIHAQTSL